MYLHIKKIDDDQIVVDHILTGTGDEGIRRFNPWDITADEKKSPTVIWTKLEEQIKGATQQNYRVARLKFHHLRQSTSETLDEFVIRCKEQAGKCDFDPAEADERIIELITASTPIEDFQKYILDQPKTSALEAVLVQGRKYEARIVN